MPSGPATGHALHFAACRAFGWSHLVGLFVGGVLGTALFHLQHACNPCYRAHSLGYSALLASLRGSTMLTVRGLEAPASTIHTSPRCWSLCDSLDNPSRAGRP